jgi:hypothetical protein
MFPSWIGEFKGLNDLLLSENSFTGSLSSELGSLTSLT